MGTPEGHYSRLVQFLEFGVDPTSTLTYIDRATEASMLKIWNIESTSYECRATIDPANKYGGFELFRIAGVQRLPVITRENMPKTVKYLHSIVGHGDSNGLKVKWNLTYFAHDAMAYIDELLRECAGCIDFYSAIEDERTRKGHNLRLCVSQMDMRNDELDPGTQPAHKIINATSPQLEQENVADVRIIKKETNVKLPVLQLATSQQPGPSTVIKRVSELEKVKLEAMSDNDEDGESTIGDGIIFLQEIVDIHDTDVRVTRGATIRHMEEQQKLTSTHDSSFNNMTVTNTQEIVYESLAKKTFVMPEEGTSDYTAYIRKLADAASRADYNNRTNKSTVVKKGAVAKTKMTFDGSKSRVNTTQEKPGTSTRCTPFNMESHRNHLLSQRVNVGHDQLHQLKEHYQSMINLGHSPTTDDLQPFPLSPNSSNNQRPINQQSTPIRQSISENSTADIDMEVPITQGRLLIEFCGPGKRVSALYSNST